MSFWLIILPFSGALLGWILARCLIWRLFYPRAPVKIVGFTLQGIIPKRMPGLSQRAGDLLQREFVSFDGLEEKLVHKENLDKITPEIEKHIDHFLRVKLKDAMPMVAMFVGDRTITQMKEIFMTEMEALFPVIMRSYVNELQKDIDIGHIIKSKLESLPPLTIESYVLKTLGREFRYVQVAGAFLGFTIGAFQVILTLLINP